MEPSSLPSAGVAAPVGHDRESAILLDGVTRRLNSGAVLLRDLSLRVPRGGVLTIAGPSGAGKSTLLRLLNRLDSPTAGSIEILGREIDRWPVRELRQRVGMVFQEPSLLGRTVRQNLALPYSLHGVLPGDFDRRVAEVVDWVGLPAGLLDRTSTQLSVGQRQRAALARSLITRPDVLLLDEPTAALDPNTSQHLLETLARLNREAQLTIVMTSHRFSDMRRFGGRLAVLISGELKADDALTTLLDHPPTPEVAQFLQSDAEGAHRQSGQDES